MMIKKKMTIRSWLTVLFVCLLPAVSMRAQDVQIVSLNKYFATCIYNFTRAINWPQDCKNGNFVITVIGNKLLSAELIKLTQNYKVGLQQVTVQYYRSIDEINGFQHILFLDYLQSSKLDKVLQKIHTKNTLIVTHSEELTMTNSGSMINFIPVDGLMKFEISNTVLKSSNLALSSQLIKMAEAVY
jgi:hypothetical protein